MRTRLVSFSGLLALTLSLLVNAPGKAALPVEPPLVDFPAFTAFSGSVRASLPVQGITTSELSGFAVRRQSVSMLGVPSGWSSVERLSVDTTSIALDLSRPASAQCVQVQAVDIYKRYSAAPVRCMALLRDVAKKGSSFKGKWAFQSKVRGAYKSTLATSRVKGASVRIGKARASYVSVVVSAGPNRGVLELRAGGKVIRKISTKAKKAGLVRHIIPITGQRIQDFSLTVSSPGKGVFLDAFSLLPVAPKSDPLVGPTPVADFAASEIAEEAATLTWASATDADELAIRMIPGDYPPMDVSEGESVGSLIPTDTSVDVSGLTADTTYSYAVFARYGDEWSYPTTLSVHTAGGAATYAVPETTSTVAEGVVSVSASTESEEQVSLVLADTVKAPAIGEHLILQPTPAFPSGMFASVVGRTVLPDGSVKTELAQASLSDVFDSIKFSLSGSTESGSAPAPAQTAKSVPLVSLFECKNDKEESEDSSDLWDVEPSLKLSGPHFDVSQDFNYYIDWTGIHATLDTRLKASVDVELEISAGLKADPQLKTKCKLKPAIADKFSVSIPFGAIAGVPMQVSFTPEIGFELSLGVKGKWVATPSITVRNLVSTDEILPLTAALPGFEIKPLGNHLGLEFTAEMKFYIKGEVLIGPAIPKGFQSDIKLKVGLKGTLGLELSLGWTSENPDCVTGKVGIPLTLGIIAKFYVGAWSLGWEWNWLEIDFTPFKPRMLCPAVTADLSVGDPERQIDFVSLYQAGEVRLLGVVPDRAATLGVREFLGFVDECGVDVKVKNANGTTVASGMTYGAAPSRSSEISIPAQPNSALPLTAHFETNGVCQDPFNWTVESGSLKLLLSQDAPPSEFRSSALAGGTGHTCAIVSGGSVKCWGINTYGQLGDGTRNSSLTPVTVIGIDNAVAIDSMVEHTCALLADHTVKCWGNNYFGGLGDGTFVDSAVPVPVVGLSQVKAIAVGQFHSCALTFGGAAFCWGENGSGQLGAGYSSLVGIPNLVRVSGIESAIGIAAGGQNTCVIEVGGAVKCWGSNWGAQLGNGTSGGPQYTPSAVLGVSGAVMIEGGVGHTCAVEGSGEIKCWGMNGSGALGNGNQELQLTAVRVVGLDSPKQISIAGWHTCAVSSSDRLYCWGLNDHGQLGDGTTITRLVPTRIASLATTTSVGVGYFHSCAVADATTRCWGYNGNGQLGDGTTTDRWTPTPVRFG